MSNWFSNYKGLNWKPTNGYNESFAQQVRTIRDWFQLEKDPKRPGVDKGSKMRPYTLRGWNVLVLVQRFEWSDYRDVGGYITPIFLLKIKIFQEADRFEPIFNHTLKVEFYEDFPLTQPRIRVEHQRYYSPVENIEKTFTDENGQRHRLYVDHMYRGGWMCIYDKYDNPWDPQKHTIISAINAALDWCVWHLQEKGW